MIRRVMMLCALALPLGAGAARAQAAGDTALTLSAAAAAALRTSPRVAAAQARLEGADAGAGEARSAFFPRLAMDGAATRFQEPMVVAPLHGFDPMHPPSFETTLVQGGVSLTWTLFDGGARVARVRAARRLKEAAGSGVDAASAAVVAAAADAYLRVAAAREVLASATARTRALAAERERAVRMQASGKAARVDTLRAEAAWARARADSVSAAAEVESAVRELARQMGADAGALASRTLAPVAVPSGGPGEEASRPESGRGAGTPTPDRAALLARAEESSPELAAARRQVEAARADVSEAAAGWLPKVQTQARYAEYGSTAGAYQGEWQAGVQLSYPLFTGGQRASGVDRARANARGAEAALEAARQDLARALDRALTAWTSARGRSNALSAAERQSEEVVRIERLSLQTGAGTQTDYLAAEASLFEARAALAEARRAELSARIEVARVTGVLTPEWLGRNLEPGT